LNIYISNYVAIDLYKLKNMKVHKRFARDDYLVIDFLVVAQVPILAMVLFPKSISVVDFGEVPWRKMECDGV
jgi:hypothetical protein